MLMSISVSQGPKIVISINIISPFRVKGNHCTCVSIIYICNLLLKLVQNKKCISVASRALIHFIVDLYP